MKPRLRPKLLLSELFCSRITVVRRVFVLHALFSSNIFVLWIFQEKHKNKRHCSEQTISTNWEIKKVASSCHLLLVFVWFFFLHRLLYSWVLFSDVQHSISFSLWRYNHRRCRICGVACLISRKTFQFRISWPPSHYFNSITVALILEILQSHVNPHSIEASTQTPIVLSWGWFRSLLFKLC